MEIEKINSIRKEREEALLKIIDLYTDKDFRIPEGFLAPFKKSVVIKKVGNQDMLTTSGGIIVVEGKNTVVPNIGIVYAIGPDCSMHISPGQRVAFNQYSDLEIMILGEVYMMISEDDVYGALPNGAYVRLNTKSDVEVSREDRIERNTKFHEKKIILDLNDRDRREG